MEVLMCIYFCLHYGARLDGLKQAGKLQRGKKTEINA